mgnify:CR=1 FL=1
MMLMRKLRRKSAYARTVSALGALLGESPTLDDSVAFMALAELDYTDDEMIRCGRSTMYRIGNVIANQEFANQHADVIAKVITDRAARRIDDKTAAQILAELREKKDGKADGVGSEEAGWWSELMKVAATARPNGLEAVKKAILEFKA